MDGTSGGEETMGRPLALMLTADRQVDRRILLEADALEADGWAVRILAMPLDGIDRNPDPRVARLGIAPRTHTREFLILELYRKARGLLAMNSAVMRRLKALTWAYVVDQEKFYLDLFLSEAMRHPASIVVAHDLPMLPVAVRVGKAKRAPVVYDNHELFTEQEFSEREKRRWRAIESSYIDDAACVVAVNRSIADELERRYRIQAVHVILNAERPHFETVNHKMGLKERLGLQDDAVVGLFQGGLSSGRNLEILIEAMRHVSASQLHLVFLGDGQMAGPLSRASKDLGLSHRIHFLAAVPQSELLDLTASADFGIIPYQANCLNTYYCTPNKMFEFIAAQVPIVSSDLPELRRFVGQLGIGLVADLSNGLSAAKVLSSMATGFDQRHAFRNAIGKIRSEISWDVEGPKFAALLASFKPTSEMR